MIGLMKKFVFLTLTGLSVTAYSFDYDLNYYGVNANKLKAMGCQCDSQNEVNAFISEFYSRVARELQKRNNNLPTGIIQAGTTNSSGFLGAFSESVSDWMLPGDIMNFDRVIVFVNWPEFNN